MDDAEAITIALEAYKRPQAFRISRRARLPNGMLVLIKLAAASPEEIRNLVSDETADALPVREAAIFYLQQLLISAEDDLRQLALNEDATLQNVKDHKRSLLKWLHPDRNKNSWESALFQRVNAASARLEASLREGVAPAGLPAAPRRQRQPNYGSWQVAQRRVATAFDWRTRVIKLGVAAIAFVLLMTAAQIGLSLKQTGHAPWAISDEQNAAEMLPARPVEAQP